MSTAPDSTKLYPRRSITTPSYDLRCNWPMLRSQLLEQWTLLTEYDLEITGPNAAYIAGLIERKYGISSTLVENYLVNFARTIPVQ